MNEPKKEYGWSTAITPEEIRALGNIQKGDQMFSGDSWGDMCFCSGCLATPHYGVGFIRRPIDPGEGWEIVPWDEARKFDGRKFMEGIQFHVNGDWASAPFPRWQEGRDSTYRRRRKSEPAMEEGWELVPDSEARLFNGNLSRGVQTKWEGQWVSCNNPTWKDGAIYRRPKSKPVEQYGWLKPDCVSTPIGKRFDAKLENGEECEIFQPEYTKAPGYASSGMPIPCRIAYWHRREPAPAVMKVDACKKAFTIYSDGLASSITQEENDAFKAGWSACCAHYHVGDQSKGVK